MTPPLPSQVLAFIRSHRLIQPNERILVGVSGGPDSTALLHLLHRLAHLWPVSLGVAHFDHALRGTASAADAAWVSDLAASLNLPFHLGTGEVRRHKEEKKISLQTAARQLRLEFFREIKQTHRYDLLALGHTADDQVELFFLRLFQGAGPEGIKGMWPSSPAGIIRPLLGSSKAEILGWLESEGLAYRIDASNSSSTYRRNRVRLDLLPRLLAYNPRLGEAIYRFQTLLQEQEDFLYLEAFRAFSGLSLHQDQGSPGLPLAALRDLHPTLQKRVLRLACAQAGVPLQQLTFGHMQAALELCGRPQPTGEISLPGNWRLVREGNRISWLTAPSPLPESSEFIIANPHTGTGRFLNRTFTWQTSPATGHGRVTANPAIALMDFRRLPSPLRLRTMRPGDRFQPLGMTGHKKLQDFFVDAKIPRAHRPFIPLLLGGDQIVWVVGHRLSETVKVTPQTELILRMEACPPEDGGGPGPQP